MASNMSHNKFICNSCQKTFLWCKCVDLCSGKFNKEDILMSFLKFGDGYDMKKKERDRRQYFNDNYTKPKKKKIKFIVVDKVDFMDELRKPPRVGTTSRLQLDKNIEAGDCSVRQEELKELKEELETRKAMEKFFREKGIIGQNEYFDSKTREWKI